MEINEEHSVRASRDIHFRPAITRESAIFTHVFGGDSRASRQVGKLARDVKGGFKYAVIGSCCHGEAGTELTGTGPFVPWDWFGEHI